MNFYKKLISWYGKRTVYVLTSVIISLFIAGVYFIAIKDGSAVEEVETAKKIVSVKAVRELQGGVGDISIIGTLEAKNEARLQTESAGRVTAVNVKLGDRVSAGRVLASIENSREAAVVLQAQGSYEAALAASSQSEVGVHAAERAYNEARTNAKNAYRTAFTTNDEILRTVIDDLYSNPETNFPGLKIDGKGLAPTLSEERRRLGEVLNKWRASIEALSSNADELSLLSEAEKITKDMIELATTLSKLLSEEDANSEFTTEQITIIQSGITSARAQLDGVLASLSGSRSTLNAAKSGFEQAQIAGSNAVVSSADAQVKQALGSLRLAQSSYEKTLIRTPISGTVNALSLKVGTFVGMQEPAAVISNEGGLEVKAYVTEDDIKDIRVGDNVTVEKDVKGVVTQVGSALDPETKKIEIRIGIEGAPETLTNGQSVTVFLTRTESETTTSTKILLPITSIKMTPDGAVIFTVSNENKLVSHTVTLGAIVGEQVVLEEGVTNDMRIVLDARGLRADQIVEIK